MHEDRLVGAGAPDAFRTRCDRIDAPRSLRRSVRFGELPCLCASAAPAIANGISEQEAHHGPFAFDRGVVLVARGVALNFLH